MSINKKLLSFYHPSGKFEFAKCEEWINSLIKKEITKSNWRIYHSICEDFGNEDDNELGTFSSETLYDYLIS